MSQNNTVKLNEFLGNGLTLDKLEIGSSGVIKSVGGKGALRRRLLDMGLTPKTKVNVKKAAPMGDPIEITLRGYTLTIRKDDAKEIAVEICKEDCE